MGRVLRILWPRGKWRWPYRGFLVMLLMMPVSVEVTSQSWFCNSCHIMNTYYATWKGGTHKDVDCVKCHIPPGATNFVSAKLNGAGQVVDDLLDRTNSKPSAAVSDFACTRAGCHDMAKVRATTRKSGEATTTALTDKKRPEYFFNHAKHLDLEYAGIKVNCTTCHSHIHGDKHFETNTNACITCHLMKGVVANAEVKVASAEVRSVALETPPANPQSAIGNPQSPRSPPAKCASCHKAPDKPIVYQGLKVVHAEFIAYGAGCESCHRGVTAPAQKVKEDQCFGCHDFGMEKSGSDMVKMHTIHTQGKHKIECLGCHGVVRHGPSAQSMRLDQLDCQACHKSQHSIQQKAYKYADANAHQSPDSAAVSPMFMSHVDCTGCHIQQRALNVKPNSGASVASAVAEACDSCHKPGLGKEMIPLWQKNTRDLYAQVAKLVPPAGEGPASDKGKQLVAEAQQLMEVVRLDGSWGVHNPRYTQKLLEEARAKLVEAAKEGAK